MATDIWALPRDPSSGAVIGSYFLLHEQSDLSATLGRIRFENGRSTRALAGGDLISFVGALGKYLTLDPADDAAREALGAPAAAAVDAERTSEPPADTKPQAVADDLDAIEDAAPLIAIAQALGIDGAERWQARRLRKEIRKAREALGAPANAGTP